MKAEKKSLLSVLEPEKWQTLQDALAVVTDMAIITVDYKGVPVTKHSACNAFCERVRNVPELNSECQKCDSRGGLEAARAQEPYIYLCHNNIVDAAIPIIVNNNYLGAIMIGQVLLSDANELAELEVMCETSMHKLERHLGPDTRLRLRLPRLSLSRVQMIVNMLFHLCNYIVGEAIENNIALEIYKNTLGSSQLQGDITVHGAEKLQNIKRKLDNAIVDVHVRREDSGSRKSVSAVLGPAIEYIEANKGERCTMAQMAALCHLSQSYFSRLFFREFGESYSSYLLRSRIKWAKELLESTGMDINEIAALCGFSDSGHFIRNFKKIEGTTPARYRKYLL